MYQRILVPVDGSTTSSLGLDEAIKLAKLTGGSLRLIHVVDALTLTAGFLVPSAYYADEVTPQKKEVGEQILEQARTRVAASGVKVDTFLFDSKLPRVSETVIEQAKAWNADLIVIGTHGRRGVGRVLLGSDAEQILRMAPVPVLLVRAPEVEGKADTMV
jgi:nucleotide-binding universal stress UspA family protein